MTNFVTCPRGTDDFDTLLRGYVRAERINDIIAKPSTKRYREYMKLIQEQFLGEPILDPKDEYREKVKECLPYALAAYEKRHGVTIDCDRVYFHDDEDIKIAAVPDGVESDLIGVTMHIRQTEESYEEAVSLGMTPEMERHSQAMMLIAKTPYWVHSNYWQNLETRDRRLSDEFESTFDNKHAAALEEAMLTFLLKTRRRAIT